MPKLFKSINLKQDKSEDSLPSSKSHKIGLDQTHRNRESRCNKITSLIFMLLLASSNMIRAGAQAVEQRDTQWPGVPNRLPDGDDCTASVLPSLSSASTLIADSSRNKSIAYFTPVYDTWEVKGKGPGANINPKYKYLTDKSLEELTSPSKKYSFKKGDLHDDSVMRDLVKNIGTLLSVSFDDGVDTIYRHDGYDNYDNRSKQRIYSAAGVKALRFIAKSMACEKKRNGAETAFSAEVDTSYVTIEKRDQIFSYFFHKEKVSESTQKLLRNEIRKKDEQEINAEVHPYKRAYST